MSVFHTRLLSSSSASLSESEQEIGESQLRDGHRHGALTPTSRPCPPLLSVASDGPAHLEQGRGENPEQGPHVTERRIVLQKPQR